MWQQNFGFSKIKFTILPHKIEAHGFMWHGPWLQNQYLISIIKLFILIKASKRMKIFSKGMKWVNHPYLFTLSNPYRAVNQTLNCLVIQIVLKNLCFCILFLLSRFFRLEEGFLIRYLKLWLSEPLENL